MSDAPDMIPTTSVVIPLYNCERYLAETVRSVQAQTRTDWELIIVDDASTDSSCDVARRFLADRRIRLIQQPANRGAGQTRATGAAHARGRYIAFLDADDVWMPNKLAAQIAFMEKGRHALSCTSYETINEDGTRRNTVHVPARTGYGAFLTNTITCSHTAMVDTALIDRSLLTERDLPHDFDIPEDLDLWLTLTKEGFAMCGLDQVLAKYRKHPHSRSSSVRRAVKRTWNQYRRREGLSVPQAAHCLAWQLARAARKRI